MIFCPFCFSDFSHLTFTCSKSTIETLEKSVKNDVTLFILLKTFSSVSAVDFQQVNV